MSLWASYGDDSRLPWWIVVIDAAEGSWGPPWAIVDAPGSAYWLPRRAAWLKAKAERQRIIQRMS